MEEGEHGQIQQQEKEPYAYLKAENWSEKNADFNAPYEVTGNREVNGNVLQLLNPVNAWRVSSGRTPVEQDQQHPDKFSDVLHNIALSVNMDKPDFSISKSDIKTIEDEYREFAKSKELSEEQIAADDLILNSFKDQLAQAIEKRWKPGEERKMPDYFVPNWWIKSYKRVKKKLGEM